MMAAHRMSGCAGAGDEDDEEKKNRKGDRAKTMHTLTSGFSIGG
jgi:hypothetical protein